MALADLVIITPLDEEWHAVRDVLKPKPATVRDGPVTYYLWPAAPDYRIAGASMGRMGLSSAAVFAASALDTWDPASIVVVGIAGSLWKEGLRLGDVIVPEQIVGYEQSASADAPVGLRFRPTGRSANAALWSRAREIFNDEKLYKKWQQDGLKAAHRAGLQPERPPELHFGVLASGNIVVKTRAFAEEIMKLHPKMSAVEMEGEGLFLALHQTGSITKGLMIRGISDYADEGKDTLDDSTKGAWRRYAAENAARLLKAMLVAQAFEVKTASLKTLRLRFDPVLKPLMDEKLFINQPGAENYVFPDLFGGASPLPALRLEVSGGAKPAQARCLVIAGAAVQRIKPEPTAGGLAFTLERSREPVSVMLLLAFSAASGGFAVTCRDEFGMTYSARWPEEG